MSFRITAFLRRLALCLSMATLAPSTSQAGLVTGEWDPAFGSYLPGLSWAVRINMLIPNACTAQADDTYSTGACASANITVLDYWLRMYDTAFGDPNNFFQYLASGPSPDPLVTQPRSGVFAFGGGYTVTAVRIVNQQVAGVSLAGIVAPQTLSTFCTNPGPPVSGCGPSFSSPAESAAGNQFILSLGVNAPTLTCLDCRQDIDDPFAPENDVSSSLEGLQGFFVTYSSDDTSQAKFTDADGRALGLRLDQSANVIGQSTSINDAVTVLPPGRAPVPEPGALALALTALGALGWSRRRRG